MCVANPRVNVYHLAWDGYIRYVLLTPLFGEMIQFDDHIFSDGLVQPPTIVIDLHVLPPFFSL